MELTGKAAIVTGASGGLGSEIALALAGAGLDVVCCCHKGAAKATEVLARIRQIGRRGVVVEVDLMADGAAGRLIDEAARAAVSPIRILVNSAAVFGRTPVGSIDPAAASRMLQMDLLLPVLMSQEFARFVDSQNAREKPAGKIVNIADVGGEKPWREYSVYCAAKAGLIAATRSLAKELAPRFTVNAVAPGLVTWPDGIDEAGRKRQLGFIPAGRIAEPAEVAAAAVFLLQNDYITGQVINVDGGRTI
jgi:pteridine reductase